MGRPRLRTDEEEAEIAAYAKLNGRPAAMQHFHLSPGALGGMIERRKARVRAADDNGNEHSIPLPDDTPHEAAFEERADGRAYASATTGTIKTLDELLTACEVDLKLWRVDRYETKTYQGFRRDESKHFVFDEGKISGSADDDGHIRTITMYAVKVWLVRREEAPFEDTVGRLLAKVAKISPRPVLPAIKAKGDHLFLPVMTDIHGGRLTMDGSYTPEKTAHDMELAGDALISRALATGLDFSDILFAVGNDFANVDTLTNTTTRGTWQEMSANIRDVVRAMSWAYARIIDRFAEIARVDVVTVEGNHDRYSSQWLGLFLQAYFRNNKRVSVDVERGPRKYRRYGNNLIGMEHGDRVKASQLALMMAHEQPQMWADTKYRTFLRGHFHQEREVIHTVDGVGAVTVITFPAFCPPDEWEKVMGYMGAHRAAEGRFFHLEHGPALTFPVFVDELPQLTAAQNRKLKAAA